MTTASILINIALAVAVSAIVAGAAILVPHRLHRHAMRHDARYARYHNALATPAARPVAPRRAASDQRRAQAA
jgi:hypothetical protein